MIRLQRTVQVHTFEAEATVAVGRERPEFLAVVRLAADLGRPMNGGDVSRELLGRLPASVGRRVIERCMALDLLERKRANAPVTLTQSGAVALKEGAVLVPEEGTWRFFLLDDPLVDDALIHVERINTPNAKQERNELYAAKREKRGRPDAGKRVPAELRAAAASGYVSNSAVSTQLFEVKEIAERGRSSSPEQLQLIVEWEAEQPRPQISLRGKLAPPSKEQEANRIDCQLTPPRALAMSYDDIWISLAAVGAGLQPDRLRDWLRHADARVVPVTLKDLDQAARQSMRRNLSVPAVALDGLGLFEPTVLEEVALVPQSESDAQTWAEWLQWQSIDDYTVPAMLNKMAAKIARRFPFHEPQMPSAGALLQRAKRKPNDLRSRYLLAPADMGLWSTR